jgi:poly(3-hydroxybutyrate) depolymerase
VHVPENYSVDDQYQTIVGFHGRGASGLYFEIDTGLSEAQFTGETIMVYPDGVNRNWAGASYSTLSIEEDLQFAWDLLAKVRQDYCVDSARIYATGHSNGGGLVNLIACNATVGAEFAAFAPVSGAFYENTDDQGDCEPARNSTPILEIHGGDDEIISYDGGKGRGGELPSIPDWYVRSPKFSFDAMHAAVLLTQSVCGTRLDQWAKRDSCDDEKSEKIFNGAVEHVTWSCNRRESVVQHYKVNKGRE